MCDHTISRYDKNDAHLVLLQFACSNASSPGGGFFTSFWDRILAEYDRKGVFGAEEEGGGVRSGPGAARTILLFHIISVRPSKQPLMVRTFPKIYIELGSYFLFLQEQIKDITTSCCSGTGWQAHNSQHQQRPKLGCPQSLCSSQLIQFLSDMENEIRMCATLSKHRHLTELLATCTQAVRRKAQCDGICSDW